MATCTSNEMASLVKGYKGVVHGNSLGEWDIEFPDAIHAMSFAQTIRGMNDYSDLSFWCTRLCVRLRDGDSITSIDTPTVLTVW